MFFNVANAVRATLTLFPEQWNDDGLPSWLDHVDDSALSQLTQSIKELQSEPKPLNMVVIFAAVAIRWGSHATGRSEEEIVDEIMATPDDSADVVIRPPRD